MLPYHDRTLIGCLCSSLPRCLRSLTRQNCPLCRRPFDYDDVRKLHIDRCSRPNSPIRPSTPGTPDSCFDEFSSEARDLHNRITRIVFDGAKSTEVEDVLTQTKRWLDIQPSDEVIVLARVLWHSLTVSLRSTAPQPPRSLPSPQQVYHSP